MEMRQKSRPRARGHSEHLTAAPEMTEVPETTDGHTAVVPTCGLPATAHALLQEEGPAESPGPADEGTWAAEPPPPLPLLPRPLPEKLGAFCLQVLEFMH